MKLSLMRELVGVIFGWSLKKSVEYLILIILYTEKDLWKVKYLGLYIRIQMKY